MNLLFVFSVLWLFMLAVLVGVLQEYHISGGGGLVPAHIQRSRPDGPPVHRQWQNNGPRAAFSIPFESVECLVTRPRMWEPWSVRVFVKCQCGCQTAETISEPDLRRGPESMHCASCGVALGHPLGAFLNSHLTRSQNVYRSVSERN
jgi:hypothetical protein